MPSLTNITGEPPERSMRLRVCGRAMADRRRRYCTPKCGKRLQEALDVASGRPAGLEVPYAGISVFGLARLFPDVAWKGERHVSRFDITRQPGDDPAAALYRLVDEVGTLWHQRSHYQRSPRPAP